MPDIKYNPRFKEGSVGNIRLIQQPEPPFYAFCTSCRQQYMNPQRWIDLAATYDGGVEEVNGLLITVDDVHLCEQCAINVGRLVGMEFVGDKDEEIAKLEHELKVARGKWSFFEREIEKLKKE
jgi:hypothetical protein